MDFMDDRLRRKLIKRLRSALRPTIASHGSLTGSGRPEK